MPIRVLVFCSDAWHPARIVRRGLSGLQKRGFEFDWLENAGVWSAEQMAGYPLIVLSKANHISETDDRAWMTPEIEQAFVAHVRQGNGLVVVHSGTAGYEKCATLRGLMGGVFLEHPDACPVTVEPVPDHPLTAGSVPFTLTDEHYFMALDDSGADLFLTTASAHGRQPGGWTRSAGRGRVAVLTPSHTLQGWTHPSFQILLENALRWCGKLA